MNLISLTIEYEVYLREKMLVEIAELRINITLLSINNKGINIIDLIGFYYNILKRA